MKLELEHETIIRKFLWEIYFETNDISAVELFMEEVKIKDIPLEQYSMHL